MLGKLVSIYMSPLFTSITKGIVMTGESGNVGSDSTISLADPNLIDGYRYNPNDGRWYKNNENVPYYELPGGKPPTDYPWQDPAGPRKQGELTIRREAAIEINDQLENSAHHPYDQAKTPFNAAKKTRAPRRDPLLLDFDGDGIETTGLEDGAYFDLDASGTAERVGWVKGDDGILVLDRNGDGHINDGRELFGDQTILRSGARSLTGYEALSEWDDNGDGVIDGRDPIFSELQVWQDKNGNGLSGADELRGLAELNIRSLSLDYGPGAQSNLAGNVQARAGAYTRADGTTGLMGDFLLTRDVTDTVANAWVTKAEKRLMRWVEWVKALARAYGAMPFGYCAHGLGVFLKKPSWRSFMLLAFIITIPFSSAVYSAEPEMDCNQFVTMEKNPSADFKPEWLTPEMEQWDRERQYIEAWNHLSKKDTEEDLRKALYWFCRSAVSGYLHAEEQVASLYREGNFVPKDGVTAFKWMLRAAKHGQWSAQVKVAKMYSLGEGTEQNAVEAKKWEDVVMKRSELIFREIKMINELKNQIDNSSR